jgi:hypothetical protein
MVYQMAPQLIEVCQVEEIHGSPVVGWCADENLQER